MYKVKVLVMIAKNKIKDISKTRNRKQFVKRSPTQKNKEKVIWKTIIRQRLKTKSSKFLPNSQINWWIVIKVDINELNSKANLY